MRKRVVAMVFVAALLVTATASAQWVKGKSSPSAKQGTQQHPKTFRGGGSKSHQAQ